MWVKRQNFLVLISAPQTAMRAFKSSRVKSGKFLTISAMADTEEKFAHYFCGDGASQLNLQAIDHLKTVSNRDEIIQRIQIRLSKQTA